MLLRVLEFYWNFEDHFDRAFGEKTKDPKCCPFVCPLFYILFTICVVFPCLPWILLYGFVIIPNEPYVKFCKDGARGGFDGEGVGHHVRAFLSNETETWECPPKPGSTWAKQSIHKDWQCNETYCTADELASPESCLGATTYEPYAWETITVWCDNWSADNPGCCQNVYDGTYVECEYCIPDKTILWVISIFAGIATTLACVVAFDYANYKYRKVMEKAKQRTAPTDAMPRSSVPLWQQWQERVARKVEAKAKKDAEAAEHGV